MPTNNKTDPLSLRATGLYFRTPKGVMERYETAPGDNAHWYLDVKRGIWRAFTEDQVKPAKAPSTRRK